LQLLTDDKLREEMGRNARQHTMDNFQYRDVARKAYQLIQERIGKE